MKFFKGKSDVSRSRRGERLRILRMREFGLIAGVCLVTGAMGYFGYHSRFVQEFGNRLRGQTLAATAKAGFQVKDVLVTGRARIPAADLLAQLNVKQNAPIFGVDIVEAQKALMTLPWVKSAAVTRRLPDRILVELEERHPAALWQYKKKISLIDQEGVVLPVRDLAPYKRLPLVVGEDAPKHVGELTTLLYAAPSIAGGLSSAVRVGGRRWDFHLQNGISVKLPEKDVTLALSYLLAEAEKNKIFERDIESIDLREPEKMVILPGEAARLAVTTNVSKS